MLYRSADWVMTGLVCMLANHFPWIITSASTHDTIKVIVLGVKLLGKSIKLKISLICAQTFPVQSLPVGLVVLLE